MRSITTIDTSLTEILRDFNRFSVGFEPTFRMLDQVSRSSASAGYPPYDLEVTSNGEDGNYSYKLTMAVAGFTPDQLEITLQDSMLTIEGKPHQDDGKNYLHKGIAGRSFRRVFYLNNMIKIVGSSLENGMLTIDFVYEIPENRKPRRIPIGSKDRTSTIESSDLSSFGLTQG